VSPFPPFVSCSDINPFPFFRNSLTPITEVGYLNEECNMFDVIGYDPMKMERLRRIFFEGRVSKEDFL